MSIKKIVIILLFFHFIFFSSFLFSQQEGIQRDQYIIGPGEKLMITVHIFGEVRRPGEFLVPDDTNILELISKAGGTTEFSNLNKVKITRGLVGSAKINQFAKKESGKSSDKTKSIKLPKKKVIDVNLKKFLDKENYYFTLPTLQPGDIVRVGRNTWYTWQAVIRVVSQVAIVIQAMYFYEI